MNDREMADLGNRKRIAAIGAMLEGDILAEEMLIALGKELVSLARLCSYCAGTGEDDDGEELRFNCKHCNGRVTTQDKALASNEPFQARVHSWMMECFCEAISADKQERNHRFLEEALELVQACGATQSEAYQLVDYVYGRPVGEPSQEVGGVAVTLAALCSAHRMDMHQAGETELARIWTKVEQIRAKQAAKPKHSPLPAAAPIVVPNDAGPELLDALENSISALSFMLEYEMKGENRPEWVRIKRDRLDAARAAIAKATKS